METAPQEAPLTPTKPVEIGRARTKIVATVGPACRSPAQLAELVEAGADIFRLNMAHATHEQHTAAIAAIRDLETTLDRPLGVLIDLAGPKIRLGELPGDEVECHEGAIFRFVRGDTITQPGDFVTTYERLVDELSPGDRVMLADGTVGLVVERREPDAAICRVTQTGTVRSRQGVNLPGVKLSVPALTEEDEADAAWAAEAGVDFVGLSFVRTAKDIEGLRELLSSHGSSALIIAKIEKPEALECLDEVVEAADGVMIARGDLGVEIDVAAVPAAQKRIIAVCHRHQKPVITATQMLDSMQHSRRPTRAEASDVANAILDGTDACMLSGETAVGLYPRAAVEMMTRIALATEPLLRPLPPGERAARGVRPVTEAVVDGATLIAGRLDARLLVVASHSGATALAVSKRRSLVRVIGVSDLDSTLRRMTLLWGVVPVAGAPHQPGAALIRYVERWARRRNWLAERDYLVLIAGRGLRAPGHNLMLVHQAE
ncbi:MAG: pyruvate kinase [Pirellulales bacterium]|nr:pyruvate kinase [Pirellulales bacterium]